MKTNAKSVFVKVMQQTSNDINIETEKETEHDDTQIRSCAPQIDFKVMQSGTLAKCIPRPPECLEHVSRSGGQTGNPQAETSQPVDPGGVGEFHSPRLRTPSF